MWATNDGQAVYSSMRRLGTTLDVKLDTSNGLVKRAQSSTITELKESAYGSYSEMIKSLRREYFFLLAKYVNKISKVHHRRSQGDFSQGLKQLHRLRGDLKEILGKLTQILITYIQRKNEQIRRLKRFRKYNPFKKIHNIQHSLQLQIQQQNSGKILPEGVASNPDEKHPDTKFLHQDSTASQIRAHSPNQGGRFAAIARQVTFDQGNQSNQGSLGRNLPFMKTIVSDGSFEDTALENKQPVIYQKLNSAFFCEEVLLGSLKFLFSQACYYRAMSNQQSALEVSNQRAQKTSQDLNTLQTTNQKENVLQAWPYSMLEKSSRIQSTKNLSQLENSEALFYTQDQPFRHHSAVGYNRPVLTPDQCRKQSVRYLSRILSYIKNLPSETISTQFLSLRSKVLMLMAVYKLEQNEWKLASVIYQKAFDSLYVLLTSLNNIDLNQNLAKNIALSKKCINRMLICLETMAEISLRQRHDIEKARECHLMSLFLAQNFLKTFEEYHIRVITNFERFEKNFGVVRLQKLDIIQIAKKYLEKEIVQGNYYIVEEQNQPEADDQAYMFAYQRSNEIEVILKDHDQTKSRNEYVTNQYEKLQQLMKTKQEQRKKLKQFKIRSLVDLSVFERTDSIEMDKSKSTSKPKKNVTFRGKLNRSKSMAEGSISTEQAKVGSKNSLKSSQRNFLNTTGKSFSRKNSTRVSNRSTQVCQSLQQIIETKFNHSKDPNLKDIEPKIVTQTHYFSDLEKSKVILEQQKIEIKKKFANYSMVVDPVMKRKRKLSIFGQSDGQSDRNAMNKDLGGLKFSQILDSDNLGYFKSLTQINKSSGDQQLKNSQAINPELSSQQRLAGMLNPAKNSKSYFLRQSFENSFQNCKNFSSAKKSETSDTKQNFSALIPRNHRKYDIPSQALEQLKQKARSQNIKNNSQIISLIDNTTIQQSQICDAKDYFDEKIIKNVVKNTDKRYAGLILSSAHNLKQEASYKTEKKYWDNVMKQKRLSCKGEIVSSSKKDPEGGMKLSAHDDNLATENIFKVMVCFVTLTNQYCGAIQQNKKYVKFLKHQQKMVQLSKSQAQAQNAQKLYSKKKSYCAIWREIIMRHLDIFNLVHYPQVYKKIIKDQKAKRLAALQSGMEPDLLSEHNYSHRQTEANKGYLIAKEGIESAVRELSGHLKLSKKSQKNLSKSHAHLSQSQNLLDISQIYSGRKSKAALASKKSNLLIQHSQLAHSTKQMSINAKKQKNALSLFELVKLQNELQEHGINIK